MNKIVKGDEVLVIAGSDKGKKGRVLSVICHQEKLVSCVVEGLNMRQHFTRANPQQNEQGGIQRKEAPLAINKVMVLDAKGNRSRVGFKVGSDGRKVRVTKTTGEEIAAA